MGMILLSHVMNADGKYVLIVLEFVKRSCVIGLLVDYVMWGSLEHVDDIKYGILEFCCYQIVYTKSYMTRSFSYIFLHMIILYF